MNEYTIVVPKGEVISVRNIYCIGRNYLDHISELNNDEPDEPFFFQKSLPSLNTSDLIDIPEGREIHHELEIVIFIHKDGEYILSDNATSYIGGYALGLDLTDRPFQNELKDKKVIGEHGIEVGKKLGFMLSGGDTMPSTILTEQNLYDLEREIFVFLFSQKPTQERIRHTLDTGKPLFN